MPRRYAVLFKTHFWDAFCERQLSDLQKVCDNGDIFIFVDQTNGFIDVPTSYPVIHASEASCRLLGLQLEPPGKLYWYCNDYPTYFLYRRCPDYDYYVIIEYDVACRLSLDRLVAAVAAKGYDGVGKPHWMPIEAWHWVGTGAGVYPSTAEMRHGLYCLAIFSNAAVATMFRRRRELTVSWRQGDIANWPYGELFMPTELHRAGLRSGALSEFGSTEGYDWWPPTLEHRVGADDESAFVHPYLDEPRYLASCLKFTADLADYFDPQSDLGRRLALVAQPHAVRAMLGELRRRKATGLIERLRKETPADVQDSAGMRFDVARGKPTTQSSTSPWSKFDDVQRDSAGAVNGAITGGYGFHTGEDDPAWWMVDLTSLHSIQTILIYNRLDVRFRARAISIYHSREMMEWHFLARSDTEHDFGGADGHPLRIDLPDPVVLRFLRIQTKGRSMMHLDQVQLIGEPVT